MTEQELEARFGAQLDLEVTTAQRNKTVGRMRRPVSNNSEGTLVLSSGVRPPDTSDDTKFARIVLKVTNLSSTSTETPSFEVGPGLTRIGRDSENEVCIKADNKMSASSHAIIEYSEGLFYLKDGGCDYSASIKLIPEKMTWVFETGARFSVGSSIFQCCGTNGEGSLLVEIVGGILRGERRFVTKKGVTLGRHASNGIALPQDREVSKNHAAIVYDQATNKYFVKDTNSTNGTYMQLVGPYGNRYKLNINDNILIGRTGFSVNRFDIGVIEEQGVMSYMEDKTAIFQYIRIPALSNSLVSPVSYFAVYDGHGGGEASAYLEKTLHRNIIESLAIGARDIQAAAHGPVLDGLVTKALRDSFLKTDYQFLNTSQHPDHGSTATTLLVLGQRLYCANVGDSRTVLCRNFAAIPMSVDHKPSRPDETKRIRDAGGYIIDNRVMRVLAVSRSFGDATLKKSVRVIPLSHLSNCMC
jgi:serine/threonine protein phosphatase PrpC